MCGICGILNENPNQPIDEVELRNMRDVMVHRGPDDAGVFSDKHIGLGHRRLSIIDISSGHQPLSNEDDSIWIVFNGEIYNYKALRKDLLAKGHLFKTMSDTETIVHLYEEYGVECVKFLNGMFAFAIWDKNEQTLFLARDRLGIKPLYFYEDKDSFVFASEIKSILANASVKRQANENVFEEFLFFRYVAGHQTFFKDVFALLPGHYLVAKSGRINIHQFWSSEQRIGAPGMQPNHYLEELKEMIWDSVRIRLMSEVPLGTACSGGVDSSLVSAYASMMMDLPLKTFSVGFHEAEFDETNFAQLVADQFKTEHHEIIVSNEEFANSLPKLIWHNDEPLNHPNSVQTYLLNKFAKQHVTVMLTGEGADELLGGYPRYFIPKFSYYYAKLPSGIKKVLKVCLKLSKARRIRKIFEILDLPPKEGAILSSFYVSKDIVEQVMPRPLGQRFDYRQSAFELSSTDGASVNDFMTQVLILDLKTYLVSLLNRQDKMSMAASIECRVPFLDHRLVEFGLSIPFNLKMKGGQTKMILKKLASRVLPKKAIYRNKSGFGVPIDEWFRATKGISEHLDLLTSSAFRNRSYFDHRAVERLIDAHRRRSVECGELLWEFINFEIWAKTFIDK